MNDRSRFSARGCAALSLGALLLWLGDACAQQADSLPPAGIEPSMLDTVVVTAQKRPQPARDVPISMTVLGGDDLERARVGSLEDLQQLVPSFSMESQSGFDALTIRGVGGGGRNIGFDPRVGVYVDGIYMSQAQALRQPLFDIERIEVLRGPQGHLFGRNTVAGAVNITTREPTREFESTARGGVGNYGMKEGFAVVAGPLAENVLGKIAVGAETRDGFTANLYDGRKLDDQQRSMARGQIVIQPSERLKLSLAADVSQTRQKLILGEPTSGMSGAPLAGGPLPKRTVNFSTTPLENADLAGGSATAHYTLDGGHVLTAIAGVRNTHHLKTNDNDYGPNDVLHVYFVDDFRQYSGEVRLASPNQGRARYVVGLYYLNETARTDRKAIIGLDAGAALALAPDVIPSDGRVKTASSALFGALDYDIAPAWTLNLGARYTHERKEVLYNLDGSGAAGVAFGIGTLAGYRDSRSENRLSPTVGATWAVSPRQNIYAKYSRGFKSGGWNTEFLSTNGVKKPSFDSERVDSVEAGTKGTLSGDRLRYEVAAYASRFKDFQVFQFVDLGGGATSIDLRNAAEAQSRGVDAAVTLRATRQLELGARFGWVSATFQSFNTCSSSVDCTGHRLPYAPGFTSALTVKYGVPLADAGGRLDLYGEYSYHGKSFMDPVNDPVTQNIPSRELVNLRADYSPGGSHWSFGIWVRNLFDKDTVAQRLRDFLGNLISRRVDPRTVGIEANFSF